MNKRFLRTATLIGLWPALLCCFAIGCGGDGTYRVSGKITFKGQPVPAGKIYFLPDGSQKNSGPTGYADIKDGYYDTGRSGGKGAVAGPVTIAIEGIDPSGNKGKPDPSGEVTTTVLFARYEVSAELPKSSSTKDIDVPAEAAKGPTPPKTGGTIIP